MSKTCMFFSSEFSHELVSSWVSLNFHVKTLGCLETEALTAQLKQTLTQPWPWCSCFLFLRLFFLGGGQVK